MLLEILLLYDGFKYMLSGFKIASKSKLKVLRDLEHTYSSSLKNVRISKKKILWKPIKSPGVIPSPLVHLLLGHK